MLFNELKLVYEKLNALNNTRTIFYTPNGLTNEQSTDGILIDSKDAFKLVSFYRQAYNIQNLVPCVSCRKTKEAELEMRFKEFLIEIEKKYGQENHCPECK